MTLLDFISPLKSKEVKVSVLDGDDNDIIKFYSEGYAGVEDTVLSRAVKRWTIEAQSHIKVVLDDVATNEPATDTSEQTPVEPTEP